MRNVFLSLVFVFAVALAAWATNNPHSATVTLTSAGTVYPWTIPFKCNAMTIKSRTAADFKMSTEADASIYMTVTSGTAYSEAAVQNYNGVLYFTSANAGQIIEILYWSQN